MEKIKIGKIVNAVALKGEVKVYSYSDYKERFEEIDRVILSDGREFKIENVRYQKNMAIIKFKGVDDRNGAEALKEKEVFITEEDLRELPDDTFYIRDLIGCKVCDSESGMTIGVVSDVLQNTAQDIYQVDLEKGGQVLIPAVKEFIKSVDIDEKVVEVSLIPGFIDEAFEI
ncbi:MAG: 16S rRNA processing protein RimM [Firmicutes bacterium]|jgi:16S rRNA processing protein RimM|nr:16S rRNA processing protein RimM [Bacillota bacterium]